MKKISIIFLFFISCNIFSQEIIKDTTIVSQFDYLRNSDLLFYDNYYYLSGFSSQSYTGAIDLLKLDDNFKIIWESKKNFDQMTSTQFSYVNKSNNINQICYYGNLIPYLYLKTVNLSGIAIYQPDSIDLENNWLVSYGITLLNYDFNIYHIYSMGSDSEGRLVLQTFDPNGKIVSDKKIYQINYSIYKEIDIYSAISTKDSGFLVFGDLYSKSKKKYDMFIHKYDKNKNIVWEKILESDSARQIPGNIFETSNGDILLVGKLRPFMKTINRYTHYIKKFDSKGNFIWEKNYFENLEISNTKLFEAPNNDYYIIANSFQKEAETLPDFIITFVY